MDSKKHKEVNPKIISQVKSAREIKECNFGIIFIIWIVRISLQAYRLGRFISIAAPKLLKILLEMLILNRLQILQKQYLISRSH